MVVIRNLYLFAVILLLILLIVIYANVILFLICFILSILFGIVLYLETKLSSTEADYELFKQNQPVHFIERDVDFRNYLNNAIENKVNVVTGVDFNKQFTGDNNINNQLNDTIELIFKDYVHSWYNLISINHEFPQKLYFIINYTISSFAKRVKKANITNLITTKLVDDLIKHIRLYRLTKHKLDFKIYNDDEFFNTFFSNERKLEKHFSREKICCNKDALVDFLLPICDILQYLLIPYNSFKNEAFKLITKEIFVKTILVPLLDNLSEPDFINGIIISICKSYVPSTETFISILQLTKNVDELNAVFESVENEILFVRSKDDDDDEMKMKQQLGSLLFLKKIILSHLKKFNDEEQTEDLRESVEDDTVFKQMEGLKNISISFDSILHHNIALKHFIDFMSSINASNYINFYINVESFKISVEQGMFEVYLGNFNDNKTNEQSEQLKKLIREAALNIYETYLSDNGPSKLELIDKSYCQKVYELLYSSDASSTYVSESLFDNIYYRVREIILKHENFFPSFKKSKHFLKLFEEVDLKENFSKSNSMKSFEDLSEIDSPSSDNRLTDTKEFSNFNKENELSNNVNVEDVKSISSDKSIANSDCNKSPEKRRLSKFNLEIIETGVLNDHGRTFVAYLINVEMHDNQKWVILRRYSEFYTFHKQMFDKSEQFNFDLKSILFLPPKTVLRNRLNQNFVQYRRHMLNQYLKKLNYVYENFPFLRDNIEKFIQSGNYLTNTNEDSNNHNSKQNKLENNQPKNLILNPIKSIGNAVRNGSENILDGFQKLGRTLSLQPDISIENKSAQSNSLGSKQQNFSRKSSYNNTESETKSSNDYSSNEDILNFDSNPDCEENIPLLLLLDEILDFKSQHFWFRRRILDLFRQIIETTYSDTINRKISDYIDEWTSSAAVNEYVKLFKNSFWQNGNLLETTPRTKEDILRRKVAAKALILTIFSDFKKVVGNETLQAGLLSFFELFQNKTLNLRLCLVLLEQVLKEIFPNNYLEEIFTKLYLSFDLPRSSQSSPKSDHNKTDWPPYLSKFMARI